jgi:hypothetical protein
MRPLPAWFFEVALVKAFALCDLLALVHGLAVNETSVHPWCRA